MRTEQLLRDALADAGEEPVAMDVLQRRILARTSPRRHRRSVGVVVAVVAAVLAVVIGVPVVLGLHGRLASSPAGPTPSSTTLETASGPTIRGLRTDPDDRGLAASYEGGTCDGPAHLAVTEAPTRIDVDVVVESNPSVCAFGVGTSGLVSARLATPVGGRTIWSGGRQQIPFDGSRLLVPASSGSARTGEQGRIADYDSRVRVTDSWYTTYGNPGPRIMGSRCDPALGWVSVQLVPANDLPGDWKKVGSARVGAAEAAVYRSGNPDAPVVRQAVVWPTTGGVVELIAEIRCGHYRPLDEAELLAVARSLQPA